MIVDGTNTTVNSTTLQVDDPQIILARNNSGTDVDAGIIINRSGQTGYQANNNVAFYWNEGDNVFKAVATTSDGSGTTITDTALANIRVGEPSNSSDAVTKSYADALTGQSTLVTGDDSTTITVGGSNRTLNILGGDNISTVGVEASQTLTIAVNHDLTET